MWSEIHSVVMVCIGNERGETTTNIILVFTIMRSIQAGRFQLTNQNGMHSFSLRNETSIPLYTKLC